MDIQITNINYEFQDHALSIFADVIRSDGSTTRAVEWLSDGLLENVDTHLDTCQSDDFSSDEIVKIKAAFKSFITENPSPEFSYEWRSENGNGELSGYKCAKEDLDKHLAEWKSELLAQCADDEECEGILSGSFVVSHPIVADMEISVRDVIVDKDDEVKEDILSLACLAFLPDFEYQKVDLR